MTGLRDLDTENEEVISMLVDTYVRWVEDTDIDGFRLDAVPHAPHAFWRTFAERFRARMTEIGKPRFLLLGEVFDADPRVLASYTAEGGLDAVFDFSLKADLIDAVILDGASAATAVPALTTHRGLYPSSSAERGIGVDPWRARVAFADNHDMWRIGAEIDDVRVTLLSMIALFTVDAIPCVYYGTEQGFVGRGGHGSRERLWPTGFREDTAIFEWIAHLADLRAKLPALRRGALVVRHASTAPGGGGADDAGIIAWERSLEDQRVLVVLNTSPNRASAAAIPTGFSPGAVLQDAMSGEGSPRIVADDGRLMVRLEPRSALILRTAP